MNPRMSTSPVTAESLSVNWSTLWDGIAQALPDRPAVISGGQTTTYRQLESNSARLATTLARHGIGPGTKVAVYLYNRPEYLETIYAALKLGAVPVNINFRYRAAELAALILGSDSEALIYPTSLSEHVVAAMKVADLSRLLLIQVDDAPGPLVAGAILFSETQKSDPLGHRQLSGEDEIFIFTGGTTGLPKAVVYQLGALFDAQSYSTYGILGLAVPQTIDEVVATAADPRTPTPKVLPITPLMHAMAMFNVMNTLLLGGTVVLLGQANFDARQALRAVEEHGVTRIIIAGNAVSGPLVDELDRGRELGTPYDVSTVGSIMSSGMLWSDQFKAGLFRHLTAQLLDIVGSTEGGPFAYSVVESADGLPSTLRLAQGAVVLNLHDKEFPPNATGVGLLAYRGKMPLGYYRDPVKTAEVYRTIGSVRYVVPGDFVRLEADGTVEFLGRGSSVVNSGGEKVYPAEVEEAILSHPAISDCVVFGSPDPRWGEVVTAAVVPKPGSTIAIADVTAYLEGMLAGYKRPRLLSVVDSLSRSPTGKVSVPDLRRRLATLAQTQGDDRAN